MVTRENVEAEASEGVGAAEGARDVARAAVYVSIVGAKGLRACWSTWYYPMLTIATCSRTQTRLRMFESSGREGRSTGESTRAGRAGTQVWWARDSTKW